MTRECLFQTPTFTAPTPDPNCMLEKMGVNSKKLGSLLNVVLSICIQLLYNHDDPCEKSKLINKLEETMGEMMCFMDGMPAEGQGLLAGILGPLLKAVGELLQALLGSEGVLGAVGGLLSDVVNLVLCLLDSLGLSLDLDLMLQIGNLLSLDLGALLRLG